MTRRTTDIVLWLFLGLFALVLLLPDAFPRTFGSPIVEPAVLLLPLCFVLIHGSIRYGLTGILVFLALVFVVSNIMENVGVATGFPFGRYQYTDAWDPSWGPEGLALLTVSLGLTLLPHRALECGRAPDRAPSP